jgi:hypothetical protein
MSDQIDLKFDKFENNEYIQMLKMGIVQPITILRFHANQPELWIPAIKGKIKKEDLKYYPIKNCGIIEMWFNDVVNEMPIEDLGYFDAYCQGKEHVWLSAVKRRQNEKI